LFCIKYKNIFQKDLDRAKKPGKDLAKLKEVMRLLVEGKQLPSIFRDHVLIGNYKDRRECHIEPNWLLIYKKEIDTIIFERTGTHSDLFNS
jgi:mRNA interferase YafQ